MIRAAEPSADSTPKPQFAFRVGITGARKLEESALPGLRRQLDHILRTLQETLLALLQTQEAAGSYAKESVLLRMISPLAEGADRLAAEAALRQGYRLEAALPFSPAEYERDFPATVPAFRALLAAAGPNIHLLEGSRAEENRSYEAVGRFVVHHCDLLLAIWDGGPSRGRGGTAEIVQYAAQYGPPVWWLQADGIGQPGWLQGRHASTRLESYLRQCVERK